MFQVVKKTEAESLTAFNRYVVVDRWINIILTYRTDQKKPNRERLTECILLPFHTHSHSHSLAIPNQFWGGGGRGYLTKFYTGSLHPEVQLLTLLYTILIEKVPLLYTFY